MDVREVCNRPPSAERGGLGGIFPPILGCTSTQGDFPLRGCVTDSVRGWGTAYVVRPSVQTLARLGGMLGVFPSPNLKPYAQHVYLNIVKICAA